MDAWALSSQTRGDYKSVKTLYGNTGKRHTHTHGSGKPVHRDRRLYGSEAEAKAAAEAQLGELTRGKLQFETEGAGMPTVFAEAFVQAEGFDPDVDGEYLIKTVRHTLDSDGYKTTISMETKGS